MTGRRAVAALDAVLRLLDSTAAQARETATARPADVTAGEVAHRVECLARDARVIVAGPVTAGA